jgi:hypothetical protein
MVVSFAGTLWQYTLVSPVSVEASPVTATLHSGTQGVVVPP